MEKIDFKKRDKALYRPKQTPVVLDVPCLTYLMLDGQGDPNEVNGAYQQAIHVLYALSYQIKRCGGSDLCPVGYYDYVVPPLESLWQMADGGAMDYAHKERLQWRAMLRQPEFVDENILTWAKQTLWQKKGVIADHVQLVYWQEGLCVQTLHIGSYDDEPQTIERLHQFAREQQLTIDQGIRRHHEIYLSDARRIVAAKRKTILRLPVKKEI